MIDLDAIRKVVERATGWGWEAAYRQDVAALISEVERLRGHRGSCTENLLKGYETGKAEERAAVVAWLRRGDACCAANATRIESGAHHREEET